MVNNKKFHFRQGVKNIPEICAVLGVRKVVIAPGSRNAPLIFAFTAHSEMECLSCTDERSAAYFALGQAQQSAEAVALICTSGTALLNFAPAIAEAYYQNLPLLVFTADRPAEMIDQADGQTLRQNNIYANYCKASFCLPVETIYAADLQFSDRLISQAIDTAVSCPRGPVQINVPLREPVYSALPDTHSHPKIIKTIAHEVAPTKESRDSLRKSWSGFTKIMVVLGVNQKNTVLNALANRLAQNPGVVVIAENLSNVTGNNIITQPESFFSSLSEEEKELYRPDLLVTIGNYVICKQLKLFLREYPPTEQWQFESSSPYIDTYKCLTTIVPGLAAELLSDMPIVNTTAGYSELFQHRMSRISKLHEDFVNQPGLSDMTVVAHLLKLIPENTVLHLGNSTSVRWTQLFPAHTGLTYICNRGTSGIDGSLSTAAGYAYASKRPTVFLTGDLSFIYDSNGLWNNYIGDNLKIIVLNNNGGNIFRFIGDKELMANSMDYFTTPHHVKIKSLVEAYGLNYLGCEKETTLTENLERLFKAEKATVLEIFTDSDINTKNYQGYFKHIALR